MSATSSPLSPVITLDGPTASGKGTVALRVAQALGWQVLDSGALYRLTALAAMRAQVPLDDGEALGRVARELDVSLGAQGACLNGEPVEDAIRQELVGTNASRVAALPDVRAGLLARQHAFRQHHGLVADCRDMGTVVFPDAPLKIFLIADVHARAQRRCKQLNEKGIPANLDDLLRDLQQRDLRDSQREHAPLVAASDAHELDSSTLSIEQTTDAILDLWRKRAVA